MRKSEVTDLLSKAKAAREFWIKPFNGVMFCEQRVYRFNWLPHDFPETEYIHIREVTTSDEDITRLAESYLEALEILKTTADGEFPIKSKNHAARFLRKVG